MPRFNRLWLILGLLSVFGAILASILLGAPLLAALPVLLPAALILILARERPAEMRVHQPEPDDPFDTLRNALGELMTAIDDPMVLVERQRVALANVPALTLLGEHIINEDVRLAIRHPAAADRLIGRGARDLDSLQAIHLVGLGQADKRWDLVVHDLDTDRRLVRLSDRTSNYVAERMRVDFVANASHELRTPLATLLGFIETLQDGSAASDEATRTRFLGIMFGEARRMQRLIDDLISLSRIEAEKFSPPDTAVTLSSLIAEVADAAETALPEDERGRVIKPSLSGEMQVRGDHMQLSQLLHNLIGNALKYGRSGTPVTVNVNRDGDMVRISVTDEGDGIAPEHLPRLTERFYRVDPGRSRAIGGTGLGLAIVKHIVERHRGELKIWSEVGVGTRVSVLLPALQKPLSQN